MNEHLRKEKTSMKEKMLGKKTAKLVEKMATGTLRRTANSNSCMVLYQPKAPKELSRFKKK